MILDPRRNLLTLLHDHTASTAAAVYELPRDAPDPLAPLATGFIHSTRVSCESRF